MKSKTSSRKKTGSSYIPEPWKPSAPGKTRILSALQQPKTYSHIKTEAKIQDPSLTKYLRELVFETLITKDTRSHAYNITPTGKNYLVIDKLAASVNSLTNASTLRTESLSSSNPSVGDYQRLVVFAGPDEKEFKRRIQETIEPFFKDHLILYDSETSSNQTRDREKSG